VTERPRVLVLGAGGFIGSHLVDALVARGYPVRALDRFAPNVAPLFRHDPAIELVNANFLNRGDLTEALDGVDTVVHLVSTTNPATAENDPLIDIETNVRGSVQLFDQCVQSGVRRVLYASSGGTVYGDRFSDAPISETDPTLPVSPYGIGKLSVENYLRYFRRKFGLDSVTFRVANPFGERQPFWKKQGVIPIFLEAITHRRPITVMGDGSMTRDYVYVTDVTDMIADSVGRTAVHDVYNLGSGVAISVNDVIGAIEHVTGIEAIRNQVPAPSTFVHSSVLDMSRYTAEFGAHPMTPFVEGIAKTYDYMRSFGDAQQ